MNLFDLRIFMLSIIENLQESKGVKNIRRLSEITGEDWSYIVRVLKTVELPESTQLFLKENQQPEIVKHFNLRGLPEIVRSLTNPVSEQNPEGSLMILRR